MYLTTLALHSLLRWAILIVGVIAVARGVGGLTRHRPWAPADDKAGRWFVALLDLQMLVGLLLYISLSALTAAALRDMGTAMGNPSLRYWAVEHPVGMVIAIAFAHIGRARIRKAPNDAARHRTAVVFFTLALLALLMSTPWPGTAHGRPLLPGL